MKNLAKTLEPITFSFCASIAISSVELSSLSPAKAVPKIYYGGDADVRVDCDATGDESYGNFSIDGRKSGIELTSAEGFAYFDNDRRSAQPIFVSTPPYRCS